MHKAANTLKLEPERCKSINFHFLLRGQNKQKLKIPKVGYLGENPIKVYVSEHISNSCSYSVCCVFATLFPSAVPRGRPGRLSLYSIGAHMLQHRAAIRRKQYGCPKELTGIVLII